MQTASTWPRPRLTRAALRSSEIARWVASAALGLFLILTMAIPAAAANKIVYVLLFGLVLAAPVVTHGRARIRTFAPLIILTIFAYGYVLSFLFEADRRLANQLMLSIAMLLLVYLVDWYAIDFGRLIKAAGVFLCFFSIVAILTLVVAQDSAVGGYLMQYFFEYSQGAYGQRSFLGSAMFTFRIGTAPFLFLPYCLFLASFLRKPRVRDLLALLLIGFVIALSTSRGLILGCLMASGYIILARLRPTGKLIGFCIGVVAALVFVDYLLSQTSVLSATEQSNNVKVGHVVSFVEHLTPLRILIGEGLAAFYFTSGFGFDAAQTEITLLDMARYFGVPLTIVLYVTLLLPTLRFEAYSGEKTTSVAIFAVYLAISLTNPVLFNSYGLLIVVWYWSSILEAAPDALAMSPRDRAA